MESNIVYCRKSNEYYVLDLTDESFRRYNNFGKAVSRKGYIGLSTDWLHVEVLSVITKGLGCELYYSGNKKLVNNSLQDCLSFIRHFGGYYAGNLFDNFGEYTQVIFCYPQHSKIPFKILNKVR
jgi:hypothetical protein